MLILELMGATKFSIQLSSKTASKDTKKYVYLTLFFTVRVEFLVISVWLLKEKLLTFSTSFAITFLYWEQRLIQTPF